ncbi:MAG TPA: type II toxin-antitoxin system CcdA family antitoxin [Orrella sp.]
MSGTAQLNTRIQLNEARRGLNGMCGLDYVHEIMCIGKVMTDSQINRSIRANAAGKRAVNLSLSKDVLIAAKELGINISEVCDSHLREIVRGELQRRWKVDHAEFIAAYNETVDKEGLPLEQWRGFHRPQQSLNTTAHD